MVFSSFLEKQICIYYKTFSQSDSLHTSARVTLFPLLCMYFVFPEYPLTEEEVIKITKGEVVKIRLENNKEHIDLKVKNNKFSRKIKECHENIISDHNVFFNGKYLLMNNCTLKNIDQITADYINSTNNVYLSDSLTISSGSSHTLHSLKHSFKKRWV